MNKMKKKRENNSSIDAMLWVGNLPDKYQTVDDFVKEARLRGCCRQIPLVPGWMKFGKTKIFLAHRGNHKAPERGSIFGYFVLDQIEIISRDEIAKYLCKIKNTDPLWPTDVEDYIEQLEAWDQKGLSTMKIRKRLGNKLQHDHMPNVASGNISRKPVLEENDREYMELFEEVLKKLLRTWYVGGCGNSFYEDTSRKAEGHRMCSLRKGPGSVYAVDALAATIHETFRQLLTRYLLAQSKKLGKPQQQILLRIQRENSLAWLEWMEYRKKGRWHAEHLLEYYMGPFKVAVEKHFPDWRLEYPVDHRLKSRVEVYGELVLLKNPFPILKREPQAAFRGIWHIDGDRLIDEIAEHDGKGRFVVQVYSGGEHRCPVNEPIGTKAQLATCLAEELHLNQAYARHFLDELATTAEDQLLFHGKFKLPGIGIIRVGKREPKIRFRPAEAISAINPLNSKKKKSQKITFLPYEAISRIVDSRPTGKRPVRIQKRKELAACLAAQLAVKSSLADRFLGELPQMALRQLAKFGYFRLPGIGRITL
jgi:nucleoid DNA-binding protein